MNLIVVKQLFNLDFNWLMSVHILLLKKKQKKKTSVTSCKCKMPVCNLEKYKPTMLCTA